MKFRIHILPLMACCIFAGMTALASDPASPEIVCAPGVGQPQDSEGICTEPESAVSPAMPEGSLQLLLPLQNSRVAGKDSRRTADDQGQPKNPDNTIIVYFFWGKGCPHCEEEKEFLDGLQRAYPSLDIRAYEVWYHRENAGLMAAMLRAHGARSSGVPVTFIGDQLFSGFTAQTRGALGKVIEGCSAVPCGDPAERPDKNTHPREQTTTPRPFAAGSTSGTGAAETDAAVTIPILGTLDARTSSLPLLTLMIAGMDSFNPCAFFVLLSLLGLLVHAQSRNKMLLIGGIFVFFSGFIYFLFMAAWLNLFLVMGHVAVITTIAGGVSVIIAGINIKDFFLFKRGLSLTIPDSAKPKLFDRMRKLLRSTSLLSIMIGTTVLAVVANFYELLCTAGFPMVFTRILTLNNLSTATYYLYLVLYNLVYVVPLSIIVLGFTLTLGKRQLSEWQGRVLKLVSGAMMLGLGIVLLVNPALLNNVLVSFIILISALGSSLLVAMVTRRLEG